MSIIRSCVVAAGLFAVGGLAAAASASPFTLTYCATASSGGGYIYNFKLTMDNNDGSWAPGQGIGWIVFGDAPSGETSPIADFAVDPSSLPIGPWTQIQGTGGGHNGPTFGPVVVQQPPFDAIFWVPEAVGDSLEWAGFAANDTPAGAMQWSALFAQGRGVVNFEVGAIVCQSQCSSGDFDNDGDTGTDADIEAFFACLAGNCCPTCWALGADFDADGDAGTDADIEAFFRVLAGGNC